MLGQLFSETEPLSFCFQLLEKKNEVAWEILFNMTCHVHCTRATDELSSTADFQIAKTCWVLEI